MDWVMCLLPMAVCFVGVLFSVKVSKKHKRILAAAGVMLFLCVAFGSLAVYRVQKITKPIRESDTLAVAEMNLNSFRGDVEMNDLQTDASTELYQALEEYPGCGPSIRQRRRGEGLACVLCGQPNLFGQREKGIRFSGRKGSLSGNRGNSSVSQHLYGSYRHCN